MEDVWHGLVAPTQGNLYEQEWNDAIKKLDSTTSVRVIESRIPEVKRYVIPVEEKNSNPTPLVEFKLDETNTWRCVGKSHWEGDLETGNFNKDHGKITNKLARMYIMMCEKYAMKYNWRGYTYNDEMRNSAILQLTYVGLRFNESKSASKVTVTFGIFAINRVRSL